MKKVVVVILLFSAIYANSIASKPGNFSRMGFGAYGMSCGNALSSVTTGYVNIFYNPALSVFSVNNRLDVDYTFLDLDRKLNYLSFTKYFEKKQTRNEVNPLKTAISVGMINSGVDNIEERNNNGDLLGRISTSENLFYLNVSNQFSQKLSFGITIKYYYYSLYKNIKSDAVGLDFGLLYRFNPNLNISFSIFDLNSAYRWDTSPIYQEYGSNYKETFPIIKRFGLSYNYKYDEKINASFASDYDIMDSKTKYLKGGIEFSYEDIFFLRTGFDRLNFSDKGNVKITFGFGILQNIFDYPIKLNYGYIVEPYSTENIHIIGINLVL